MVMTMTIDNRLQNIDNSEGSVVVLFVKIGCPLTPLMTSGVIDMKNKPSATKASGSRRLLPP